MHCLLPILDLARINYSHLLSDKALELTKEKDKTKRLRQLPCWPGKLLKLLLVAKGVTRNQSARCSDRHYTASSGPHSMVPGSRYHHLSVTDKKLRIQE
jgi:hypothetical protein